MTSLRSRVSLPTITALTTSALALAEAISRSTSFSVSTGLLLIQAPIISFNPCLRARSGRASRPVIE
ncbi:hypothetical protein D3C76_1508550 [compost metagenome]